MKETVISWTVANIITVALMMMIISLIGGVAVKTYSRMKARE